jgi:hypothetical protein
MDFALPPLWKRAIEPLCSEERMLTHDRLVELSRELQHESVLSVYIDGNQHDPAERNKWRTQLERA